MLLFMNFPILHSYHIMYRFCVDPSNLVALCVIVQDAHVKLDG